eukprot:SAG22_NODE_792_length_7198_cov_1.752641_6_plen_195_part_00
MRLGGPRAAPLPSVTHCLADGWHGRCPCLSAFAECCWADPGCVAVAVAVVGLVWSGLAAPRRLEQGGSKAAEPDTWRAVEKLHARGKNKIPSGTLVLRPAPGKRAMLTPARRLHKICKGRRLAARSAAAGGHLAAAMDWLAAERGKGRTVFLAASKGAPGRAALAKELAAALGVGPELARGLVTKLKQKKLVTA